MKKVIVILNMLFLTMMLQQSFAQSVPADFQEHGKNSSGATVASEAIDSVTVGSTMNYFVMPDLNVNQDADGPYDYATNKDALVSTFDWFAIPGLTITKDEENYVSVDFPASPGDYTLNVSEESTAGCSTDTTTIQVRTINAPEVGYTIAGGSEDFCVNDADGSFSVSPSPVSVTINSDVFGNRGIIISYQITSTSSSFNGGNPLNGTVSVADGDSNFSISENLTHYGTYTITLTDITDRISRKPTTDIRGSLLANTTYIVNVTRAPSTGNIYHLPNM